MHRGELLKETFIYAKENFINKRYEESLHAINEAISLYDEFPEGLELRAKIFLAMNKYFNALDDVGKWIKLVPNNPVAHHLYASICLKAALERDAVVNLLEAIRLTPEDAFVERALYHFDLGAAYNALGEKEKAEVCLQEAAEIEKKILESFEKAAEREKITLESYVESGLAQKRQGEYAKAIEIFSKGLSELPNNGELLRLRAEVYCAHKDYQAAIADYDTLVNRGMSVSGILLARGHLYVDMEEIGLAVWDFVHALKSTERFEAQVVAANALHALLLRFTKNEVLAHIKQVSVEDKKMQLLDMCLHQKDSLLARQLQECKAPVGESTLAEAKGIVGSPKSSPRGSPRGSISDFFLKKSGSKKDLKGSSDKLKLTNG